MCCVLSCLLRRGFLFPLKLTHVSSYFYGTWYPLVKPTRPGHAKGEPFRQNLRATGYSPLGPGGLHTPVSSQAARSPRCVLHPLLTDV
jgi:hypothetical protein